MSVAVQAIRGVYGVSYVIPVRSRHKDCSLNALDNRIKRNKARHNWFVSVWATQSVLHNFFENKIFKLLPSLFNLVPMIWKPSTRFKIIMPLYALPDSVVTV